MSAWLRPRNIVIAGGIGAALFLFPRTRSKVSGIDNLVETPGVKNIGDRYSAGGGSPTHQPAGGTPRGKSDQVLGNQTQQNGVGTPHFQAKLADQKNDVSSLPGEKSIHKAVYGHEKGK